MHGNLKPMIVKTDGNTERRMHPLYPKEQLKEDLSKKHTRKCFISGLCILSVIILVVICYQYRINSLYAKVAAPIPANQIPAFLDDKDAYALGLNSFGTPVFENPEEAFQQAGIDYASGIEAIQEQFQLEPISPSNWNPYKVYGAQIVLEDAALREECINVSKFFDYYENSFPDV